MARVQKGFPLDDPVDREGDEDGEHANRRPELLVSEEDDEGEIGDDPGGPGFDVFSGEHPLGEESEGGRKGFQPRERALNVGSEDRAKGDGSGDEDAEADEGEAWWEPRDLDGLDVDGFASG